MRRLPFVMAIAFMCVFAAPALLAQKLPSALSTAKPASYKESPMLAAKVKAGELPAVEKRLPKDPLVQVGPEGDGVYGAGPLRVLSNETAKIGDGRNAVAVASFVLVDYDGATLRPNLLKSWSYSKDFKELSLSLRQGVKWSDGVEFTTEDIRFWWDEVMNEPDLNKSVHTKWMTKSGPMTVQVIDKYNVKFILKDPNPDLILGMIEMSGLQLSGVYYPAHYSKKFHKKYAKAEDLDAMIKASNGYASWAQLFLAKHAAYWDAWSEDNIACPTLNSHMVTKIGPNFIELERNPYYWKVDSVGKQLPYIDKISVQIVSSQDIYSAKVATGEADFAARRTKASDLPVYKKGEAAGDYRARIWAAVGDGDYVLLMNFNNLDPAKKDLIRDLEFRKAVSMAINRAEFNTNRSFGLGQVSQIPMPVSSKFMDKSYAEMYTQYDPEGANKILDKLGLKWDASHEFRLRKDGQRLSFGMINGGERPMEGDELLAAQLRKVGIEVKPELLALDLYKNRMTSGEFDFQMRKYGMLDAAFVARPDMCLPIEYFGSDVWAPAWANWRLEKATGVNQGTFKEEPPALVKKLIDRWEQMKLLPAESPEYVAIGKELLKAEAENLWTIGILTGGPQPVIVSNRMGNVLEKGIYTYDYLMYAQYSRADSWYFKK